MTKIYTTKFDLALISSIIITITTILLITFIPIFSFQISNIDDTLEDLEGKKRIRDSNLLSDSIQRVKMSSTYANYYILKTLNSSKAQEQDSKLKIQIIESINGLSDTTFNKKELFKKSVNELADILDKIAFEYVGVYNQDVEKIANLKLEKSKKEFWFNMLIIVLGFVQSIGLLLGFIAYYKEKK